MFSIGDFVMIKGKGFIQKIKQIQYYGSGRCTMCMKYTVGIVLANARRSRKILYCE